MSEDRNNKRDKIPQKGISRRDFLVTGGTVAAGTLIGGTISKADDKKVTYPASKGYLVYDSKKCIGAQHACSPVHSPHYGVQSLSHVRASRSYRIHGGNSRMTSRWPCAGSARHRSVSRTAL